MQGYLLIYLCLWILVGLHVAIASVDWPIIDALNTVQVYFLLTPVVKSDEFDTQVNRNMHGGLGIWDMGLDGEGSTNKFSIEIDLNTSTNAIFPDVHTTDGYTFYWNNTAELSVMTPFDETKWREARLISITNGRGYNLLRRHIDDIFPASDLRFQPFNVLYYANADSSIFGGSVRGFDNVLIPAYDSFTFVTDALQYLASIGCRMTTYLPVYQPVVSYITQTSSTPAVVDLSQSTSTRRQVSEWYTNLRNCSSWKLDTAPNAEAFLFDVAECYTEYAYVYKSDTEVYNVTLSTQEHNDRPVNPYITQLMYYPPTTTNNTNYGSADVDIGVYIVLLLTITIGITLLLVSAKNRKRRRVSKLGEVLANQSVVTSLLEQQQEYRDEIVKYFYEEKKVRSWTFEKWFKVIRAKYWDGESVDEETGIDENTKARRSSFSLADIRTSNVKRPTKIQLMRAVEKHNNGKGDLIPPATLTPWRRGLQTPKEADTEL